LVLRQNDQTADAVDGVIQDMNCTQARLFTVEARREFWLGSATVILLPFDLMFMRQHTAFDGGER
jgi:hypothetical protein